MFNRILIANRGEIACRIIRSCRRLGIATVAVYSDADADALHVRLADVAVHIGGAAPADSYLRADAIIDVARQQEAQAIHPGYGFLAENPDFARACAEADLVFIGPSPETLAQMGSKSDAKATMQAAGVPTVPGYHGEAQDDERLSSEAEAIGFPLMIKAAAGGGGKGMRIVRKPEDFIRQLHSARREAQSAFGDEQVILERYIEHPRHIEVQVFGDTHGNIVHLLERDCSSQRRYQKIIEEAPAPALSDAQRSAIHRAGVEAARAVAYLGAGTVEMILAADGEFYFMEMNTRLQVEHPVTEAITGQDLVEWQLRVAAGEPLPLRQEDIHAQGHAIEARIYAEDPAANFMPASGRIDWLDFPDDVRVDTGVAEGDRVSVHYDPMIAKLIVHGADRTQALSALRAALERTAVAGLTSNVDFLAALAAHPVFAESRIHTAYLDNHLDEVLPTERELCAEAVLAAAVWRLMDEEAAAIDQQLDRADRWSPWAVADGWRPGHLGRRVISLREGDQHHRVDAWGFAGSYTLQFAEHTREVCGARREPGFLLWGDPQQRQRHPVQSRGALIQVGIAGRSHRYLAEDPFAVDKTAAAGESSLTAPMPGRVVALHAAVGDSVAAGQELAVMEAMKMELSLTAAADGTIAAVHVSQGDFVEADTVLVEFDQDD